MKRLKRPYIVTFRDGSRGNFDSVRVDGYLVVCRRIGVRIIRDEFFDIRELKSISLRYRRLPRNDDLDEDPYGTDAEFVDPIPPQTRKELTDVAYR